MRLILFLFITVLTFPIFGQIKEYKGIWISEKLDFISIKDINNEFEDANSIGKEAKELFMNVYLRGDVLSFQKKYYTSESNFEKAMIDSFDVKIISKTEKNIVIKPNNKQAINFFNTKKKITLTKQDFVVDNDFTFKKIVFHTTGCYGACPIIDLEINEEKDVYLNGIFFKDFSMFDIDSTLTGQFKGKIDESLFNRLNFILKSSCIKTLKVNETLEPEAPVISIIIYFNEDKRAFKFNAAPAILSELVDFLTLLNQEANLKRTNKRRVLETY